MFEYMLKKAVYATRQTHLNRKKKAFRMASIQVLKREKWLQQRKNWII